MCLVYYDAGETISIKIRKKYDVSVFTQLLSKMKAGETIMKMFDGMYSALFSIYDQNLNVKRDSVRGLMEYHQKNGLQGFYVGGATGECVVLPNKTRIQMLETAMEYKKDSEIIAHVGAGHWEDTVELAKHADSLDVDAIASLPPALMAYYNEEETINYYKALSELTSKPLMAYIQAFYQGDIVQLTKKLMEIPNMVGIKLTVPNYYLFARLRVAFPDVNILNGPDESVLAGLSIGANGAIGTSYNLLPGVATELYNAVQNNQLDVAKEKQFVLNKAIDTLLGNNIGVWKMPLEAIGIDTGYTVFPACAPTADRKKEILDILKQNGTIGEMLK